MEQFTLRTIARNFNITDMEERKLPGDGDVAEIVAQRVIAGLEADLKLNAGMLAKQHDRNMELETKIAELTRQRDLCLTTMEQDEKDHQQDHRDIDIKIEEIAKLKGSYEDVVGEYALEERDLRKQIVELKAALKKNFEESIAVIHDLGAEKILLEERLKGITATYEQYKHLDKLLSDHRWIADTEEELLNPRRKCLLDCWLAIRRVME